MFFKYLMNIINIDKENIDNIEYFNNTEFTKILTIYKKYIESSKTVVVLVESKKEAEKISVFFNELEEVYIYPESDLLKRYSKKSPELEELSTKILYNLVNDVKMILIVTVKSLFKTLRNPSEYSKISIDMENYPSFSKISNIVSELGYKKVDVVESIGEFSVRGSLVDIYTPTLSTPIRLDYFDEELDSIRVFDISNQKSINKIDSVEIYPNGEFFLNFDDKKKIVEKLKNRLSEKDIVDNKECEELVEHLKNKIKLFEETSIFDELDSFSNYIYDNKVYSISDYINESVFIFVINSSKIKIKLDEIKEYFISYLSETNYKYIFQDIIDEAAYDKFLNNNKVVYLNNIKSNYESIEKSIDNRYKNVPFYLNENNFVAELQDKISKNYKIIITYNKNNQKDYIEKVLLENNLYDNISKEILNKYIYIEKTKYSFSGFESENDKLILFTVNELFKSDVKVKKNIPSFKYSNSEKIRNYQDLNIGDYIVHIHHGIGIYEGIENINSQGIFKDYLKISYEGSDIIYVDIENMKYIQKYTSSTENIKPKLNKLGTKNWLQTKNKVRKEIEDISTELIRLYINRELNKGYAFSEDSYLQKEFENDFLFTATKDQEKATEEIKSDMQKDRPMDRLLCGDVGFGKTEVAMRVAFKAVTDNKQVAVLVPTTLLAEQHYYNFVNRFSNFPVNIEVVSRFKTTKEINNIINKLANGEIDIVIGTHKLLNDKFKYKDLGLLIIDEEQRFGVKHKEKIKYFKNIIDVLTLSATPIPRTLHMSLIGIRDLSVIETPPINRQPIQTFVMAENANVIREAIINEIDRKGQVFYLYNRVDTIEKKYLELKKLVPEINIAYIHGRMNKREIEDIMLDMVNKEYDMLITTTIIETGIDITNVNTLIVEDADKFGLSQLYQIRGRVGRSSREAYAYLMYKPFKILNETSEKRLTAIKNFTSLGSGFKIAMQDLTIRGAGDVLGGKQHGFIDSVGYTLYSQILEKEISEKKEILEPILKKDSGNDIEYYEKLIKEKTKITNKDIFDIESDSVEIKLLKNAYIPKEYIKNDADKIYFYKQLNNSKTKDNIYEIVEELIDRYSDFGEEVENLINICLLKILAKDIMVSKIIELSNKIVVNFKKDILKYLDGKLLFEKLNKYKNITILVKDSLIIEIRKENDYSIDQIYKVLELIIPCININKEN